MTPRRALGLVVSAVLLAGCARAPSDRRAARAPGEPLSPQVGMAAPEINGVDLDGRPFKLSDYRGKVVMLDFWRTT